MGVLLPGDGVRKHSKGLGPEVERDTQCLVARRRDDRPTSFLTNVTGTVWGRGPRLGMSSKRLPYHLHAFHLGFPLQQLLQLLLLV